MTADTIELAAAWRDQGDAAPHGLLDQSVSGSTTMYTVLLTLLLAAMPKASSSRVARRIIAAATCKAHRARYHRRHGREHRPINHALSRR